VIAVPAMLERALVFVEGVRQVTGRKDDISNRITI
jgi:hypothetical protein